MKDIIAAFILAGGAAVILAIIAAIIDLWKKISGCGLTGDWSRRQLVRW